jgi:hypothetical protein
LEAHTFSDESNVIAALNKIVDELVNKKNKLIQQISYWEKKLATASGKSQQTIQAHINKIRKIDETDIPALKIANQEKPASLLLAEQNKIIELQKNIAELEQEDSALKAVYDFIPTSNTVISVDVAALKKYASNEVKNTNRPKEAPQFDEDSLVVKSAHRSLQYIKRGIPFNQDSLADDLFRISISGSEQQREEVSSSEKNFFVYLNGEEFSREQLNEKRKANPLFDQAADYFDTGMQDLAALFLRNALLQPSLVASKTKLQFIEHKGEMYFISESEGYSYLTHKDNFRFFDDVDEKHSIPGKVTVVYKLNKKKGEEGFEWVGLYASNTLLANMLGCTTIGAYQNLTDEQIRNAQKEECISALLALRNSIKNLQPTLAQTLLNSMCNMIDKLKDRPDANLELLTEVSKTTKEYIAEPATNDKAHKFIALAPKIQKEYDASGKKMAYLMVALFITLSVLAIVFTGGLAELMLVATMGEVAAEALVTIAGIAIGVGATAKGIHTYEKNRHMTPLYENMIKTESIKDQIQAVTPQQEQQSSSKLKN